MSFQRMGNTWINPQAALQWQPSLSRFNPDIPISLESPWQTQHQIFLEKYETPIIAVRASGQASAASGTAVAIAAPTGTVAGDLVVVVVHSDGLTTIVDNNGTTPFTESINDYQHTTTGMTVSVFYYRVVSNSPTTYNFTLGASNRWTAIAVTFSNPSPLSRGLVYDVAPVANQGAAATTGSTTAMTTLIDAAIALQIMAVDGASQTITSTPATYTVQQTNNTNAVMSVCSKIIPTAGAVAAAAFVWSTSATWIGVSLAISAKFSGFDETYQDEYIQTGNGMNPNYDPNSMGGGKPPTWGSQCCGYSIGNNGAGDGASCLRQARRGPSNGGVLIHVETNIQAMSMADGTQMLCFAGKADAGLVLVAPAVCRLYYDYSAGLLHWVVVFGISPGDVAYTWPAAGAGGISGGVTYYHDIVYDIRSRRYRWLVNGQLVVSTAMPNNNYFPTNVGWYAIGASGSSTGRNTTYMMDNFTVTEIDLPSLPIPFKHYDRRRRM